MMPVSLQARLKTYPKAPGNRIGEYPLDANDSATMQVEFSNGALGVIHTSRFMTGYGNVLKLAVFRNQRRARDRAWPGVDGDPRLFRRGHPYPGLAEDCFAAGADDPCALHRCGHRGQERRAGNSGAARRCRPCWTAASRQRPSAGLRYSPTGPSQRHLIPLQPGVLFVQQKGARLEAGQSEG